MGEIPCRFESGHEHVKSGLDCFGFNPNPQRAFRFRWRRWNIARSVMAWIACGYCPEIIEHLGRTTKEPNTSVVSLINRASDKESEGGGLNPSRPTKMGTPAPNKNK